MSQSKNTDKVRVEEHYQLDAKVVNKARRYCRCNRLTLGALIEKLLWLRIDRKAYLKEQKRNRKEEEAPASFTVSIELPEIIAMAAEQACQDKGETLDELAIRLLKDDLNRRTLAKHGMGGRSHDRV